MTEMQIVGTLQALLGIGVLMWPMTIPRIMKWVARPFAGEQLGRLLDRIYKPGWIRALAMLFIILGVLMILLGGAPR